MDELAKELEVKKSTIHFYKKQLEEMGVFIKSETGRYGGYSIENRSLLPVLNLDSNEKEILLLALNRIYAKDEGFVTKDLKTVVDKIKSSILNNEQEINYVYYFNKSRPNVNSLEEKRMFHEIKSAITERRGLKISYGAANSGEVEERMIEPYGIIVYNEFFYCVARCLKRNDMRNFKFIRILKIQEVTSHRFEIPEDFNLQMHSQSATYGLVKKAQWLKIRISPPFSYLVKESIWAPDQVIVENGDGIITFEGTMSGEASIKKWILGMGAYAEVLEPENLKVNICKEIEEMLKMYK